MYQHADQSWKDKPLVLSDEHQALLGKRLQEYAREKQLQRILVIFHGGEPLIFGVDRLINLSRNIRKELNSAGCQVDFGIQTNGVLLTEKILKRFEDEDISVSLSIDGPAEIHDEHRIDHKGKASFDKVYRGLLLLKEFPKVFSGCIGVINPNHEPEKLFHFFDQNGVKEVNILLPDANHLSLPKWRDGSPEIYKNWLIKAFDCWTDSYAHIECKFFEAILSAIFGRPGESDALGNGTVSLLNIETDGTYHDLDVLKITEENYSSLGMSLETHPISSAETTKKINLHRKLLSKEGLCSKCLSCKYVDVCGGGSVPHRFNINGYRNPTVYCKEMYSLIDHMFVKLGTMIETESQKQQKTLVGNFDQVEMSSFFKSETSVLPIEKLKNHLAQKNYSRLQSILQYASQKYPEHQDTILEVQSFSFQDTKKALLHPPVYSWLRAFYGESIDSPLPNIDGIKLFADPTYFETFVQLVKEERDDQNFIIQDADRWFARSLGQSIVLNHPENEFENGLKNLEIALRIVQEYDNDLYKQMLLVSPHIQIVKDTNANAEKDVSFSNETLPGAIFIGVWKGKGLLCPYMVAASIIHEHLHQKLYLLQQRFELFPPQETPVFSPWPNLYRPPVGALHAVYVFTHVAHFWNQMLIVENEVQTSEYELRTTLEKLDQCITDIENSVVFTETGGRFFQCLLETYHALKENSVLLHV